MATRARSFWLCCLAVSYVCFAAIQADARVLWPLSALVGLPLLLAEAWRRTEPARHRSGEDRIDPQARQALRVAFFGAALWVAARTGPAGRAAFDAAANVGAGAATVAALVALARVPSIGGMLTPPSATRSLDAAALAAFLWSIAVALPATRAMLSAHVVRLDPLAIDYATTSASLGGLLVLVAATVRLRLTRRLEIGVADRAAGAVALTVTALLIAVPAAAFDVAAPDRVLPVALIAASIACTWTATTSEPTTVSSALRGIMAVMILGAPTALASGLLARAKPDHAGAIVLVSALANIAIGLVARAVARPLGPEQSRWLEAIEAASRSALQPEPDAAIRAALVSLSHACATAGARPELWRNDPQEVLSVDIAGYLHVDKAEAPERLYDLALGEPERTLRADVIAALEIRRPDVRPLSAWFQTRRAFSATLVLDEDGPIGFILLPRGNRTSPMTLEEARAVRVLADRISALLAVSSALARSRHRELSAVRRADALDDERQRLEHAVFHAGGRYSALVERAAARVRAAAYSPASRLTVEQLQRLGRMNASACLVTPVGGSVEGWASILHLASPRSAGPFVVVDGASGFEHHVARWQAPDDSPLALADGGTLVVLDAPALPAEIQEHIARSLSRQSSISQHSSVLPPALVLTTRRSPAELVETGQLHESLARWVADAVVALPPLKDRAEDLRAITLEMLSRIGLRQGKQPLGIDHTALRMIAEHAWPGGELELEALLTKAALGSTTAALTGSDLTRAGFEPIEATAPGERDAAAPNPRRRPRPRRPSTRS